jgi:hypothetical protein
MCEKHVTKKIKILHIFIQLIVKHKTIDDRPDLVIFCTGIALLSAICCSIVASQPTIGQQQEPSNAGERGPTTNLQNLTSQQPQRILNKSEFSSYVSPALGLKIEHPNDWSPLTKQYPGDVQVLEFNATRSSMMQLLPPTVRISSAPLESNQTIAQLTKDLLRVAGGYPQFDLKQNISQSLGNVTGHKVLYTYGSGDPSQQFTLQAMDIWTIKDGKRYVFSYIAPVSEFSLNLPIVEHMIKSISFE